MAVSRLALTEVPSAVVRRWRDGVLPTATRDAALAAFDADAPHFEVVEISPAVTRRARDLLLRHPLRILDSLQLACCLELEFHSRLEIVLFAYDMRLGAAAAAEGVAVESP